MTEPGIDMHRSSRYIYARIGRGDLPPLDMIAAEGDEEKNIVVISIIYGIYNNRKKSLKRNEKCYFLFICFVMWSECAHWFIMYQLIIMVLFVFSPASPHLALPARIFQSPFALLWILRGRTERVSRVFFQQISRELRRENKSRWILSIQLVFNSFFLSWNSFLKGSLALREKIYCYSSSRILLGRGILTSDVHDNGMRLIKL